MTDPHDLEARIKALLAAHGADKPSTGYGGYPEAPSPSERRSARAVRRFERDLSKAVKNLDPAAARAATDRLLDSLALNNGRTADTDPTTGNSPRTGARP